MDEEDADVGLALVELRVGDPPALGAVDLDLVRPALARLEERRRRVREGVRARAIDEDADLGRHAARHVELDELDEEVGEERAADVVDDGREPAKGDDLEEEAGREDEDCTGWSTVVSRALRGRARGARKRDAHSSSQRKASQRTTRPTERRWSGAARLSDSCTLSLLDITAARAVRGEWAVGERAAACEGDERHLLGVGRAEGLTACA